MTTTRGELSGHLGRPLTDPEWQLIQRRARENFDVRCLLAPLAGGGAPVSRPASAQGSGRSPAPSPGRQSPLEGHPPPAPPPARRLSAFPELPPGCYCVQALDLLSPYDDVRLALAFNNKSLLSVTGTKICAWGKKRGGETFVGVLPCSAALVAAIPSDGDAGPHAVVAGFLQDGGPSSLGLLDVVPQLELATNVELTHGAECEVSCVAVQRAGGAARIASGADNNEVRIWATGGGGGGGGGGAFALVKSLPQTAPVTALCWTADGCLAVACYGLANVSVFNLAGGAAPQILPHGKHVYALAFLEAPSAPTRLLASACTTPPRHLTRACSQKVPPPPFRLPSCRRLRRRARVLVDAAGRAGGKARPARNGSQRRCRPCVPPPRQRQRRWRGACVGCCHAPMRGKSAWPQQDGVVDRHAARAVKHHALPRRPLLLRRGWR